MDFARTMFIDSGVAMNFWEELVNKCCDVTNMCLIISVIKKTPYDFLNKRKPSNAYVKPFGYKCFALNIGKDDLCKFHFGCDEGVFVGYSFANKAYKFFNERTLCVDGSRHVISN